MRRVTYSPSYTLVPTYECFNRCTYCNFRAEPGTDRWLSLEQAEFRLRSLPRGSVIEALVLSGEVHPKSHRRTAWFQRIYDLCDLALRLGFLPHTNAGPLSYEELAQLKQVNASMGLMLEQVTPALMQTVHRHAPSKQPEVRLQQLEWAGELRIPFTTGLLLGIGETAADWVDTLTAIARLHRRYGHIQEVILQPHSPGSSQTEIGEPFAPEQLTEAVAIARQLLPADIALQIPPNLVSPQTLLDCLAAGATDLGGISPIDEVNPDYAHPKADALAAQLRPGGWRLVPRLPVYPQYDDWLYPAIRERVQGFREWISETGQFKPESGEHDADR
ncbi:7,8-didemethyl-8-hydroxy-5-deazariboflavin synthase subunit CofG [Thermoleptolyngbya sp. M55_K2018_002]|uniref:7,8-didemethyl-8-hydroxy-5-deazariboflavin synthase subunit CofG n=1 Tax=Thermoleptolyngbya sp. M55_K2018_002 TaxID=2747808 RepID=UPI0019F48D1F|nr:7,8-didemethyl-8-hydroxy-5-deazariboflavin synthase subunit CofG [Thermoleptolyngbya sp. M55_K2018_002]HIK41377.1 7,8-didemethyl-8-hydroxy-5-deazariboflavin synthase subunit CofG [Thermoleptolyngbya sp. M55_K2018_002]